MKLPLCSILIAVALISSATHAAPVAVQSYPSVVVSPELALIAAVEIEGKLVKRLMGLLTAIGYIILVYLVFARKTRPQAKRRLPVANRTEVILLDINGRPFTTPSPPSSRFWKRVRRQLRRLAHICIAIPPVVALIGLAVGN